MEAGTKIVAASSADKGVPYVGLYLAMRDIWSVGGGTTAGTGAQFADWLLGSNRPANCTATSGVIPASAKIFRINFLASEGGASSEHVHQDSGAGCGASWFADGHTGRGPFVCAIGWSSFDPVIFTPAGRDVILTSVFRNWSHNRNRTALMEVVWYPCEGPKAAPAPWCP